MKIYLVALAAIGAVLGATISDDVTAQEGYAELIGVYQQARDCRVISRDNLGWLANQAQGASAQAIELQLGESCERFGFAYYPFEWDPQNGLIVFLLNDRYYGFDFYLGEK